MRGRIYLENHCYFVTVNAFNKRNIFKLDRFKMLYLETLDYCRKKFKFQLFGFVIMRDHIHLLLTPPGKYTISDVMHHVNGVFANKYNKITKNSGRVIQRKFWEHIIRNKNDFEEKLNYIHNNPVRAGLVKNLEDWKYSSFHNYYLDDESLIIIDKIEL